MRNIYWLIFVLLSLFFVNLAVAAPTVSEQRWRELGFEQGCRYAMLLVYSNPPFEKLAPVCKDLVKFIRMEEPAFIVEKNLAKEKK